MQVFGSGLGWPDLLAEPRAQALFELVVVHRFAPAAFASPSRLRRWRNVVEARTDRPSRNAERCRNLIDGQVAVITKGDHHSVIRREPRQSEAHLITLVDLSDRVSTRCRQVRGKIAERHPLGAPQPVSRVLTRMRSNHCSKRRVAELWPVPPRLDDSVMGCVLCIGRAAHDRARKTVASIEVLVGEACECPARVAAPPGCDMSVPATPPIPRPPFTMAWLREGNPISTDSRRRVCRW